MGQLIGRSNDEIRERVLWVQTLEGRRYGLNGRSRRARKEGFVTVESVSMAENLNLAAFFGRHVP